MKPAAPLGADQAADVGDGFEPVENLTTRVVSGLKWQGATQLVSEGSRAASVIVLAHLLTPADYGLAGIALVCASFTTVITDPSLGVALMRRPTITETDRSTVFWAMLALGAVTTVAGVALSGVVADIFGHRELQKLFAVLSITFVISSSTVTQMALFNRQLDFRALQIRQMAAIASGGAVAVVIAFMGFGPWAIVGNQIAYTTISALLVWTMSPWRPHASFSWSSLHAFGGFGLKIYAAELLGWSQENADNALVGRFLGSAALGAYSLAYNVMFVPMQRISQPIMQVMSPAFSRLQGDLARLESVWLRSKRLTAVLLTPAFLGGVVVAPDLIPVVFGSKWHAAILPLQLLCIAGLAQVLVTQNWSVLSALGEGGSIFRIQLVMSIVTVAGFVAGLPFGIVGVAAFFAGTRWVLVVIEVWMTTRAAGFAFRKALRAGTEALPLGVGAALVALGLRAFLVSEHAVAPLRLVAVGLVMMSMYALLTWVVSPGLVAEVRSLIARQRG
jgi:polysaccharide transporter, PST family